MIKKINNFPRNLILRFLGTVVLYCLISNHASANQEQEVSGKLSTYFDSLHEDQKFNGAVLIAKDGEILLKKAYGLIDALNNETLSENTGFELASISKVFTAVALHQLAEQGKLDYDDSITKYFPELPYNNVTIGGLLSHTSGLFDVYEQQDYRAQFFDFYGKIDPPYGNKDYFDYLVKFKPPVLAEPLVQSKYSNTAYVLLGLVVEKITGQEFDDYLTENILKPAKMEDTFIFSKMRGETIPDYAKGHRENDQNDIVRAPDPSAPPRMRGETFGDDDMVSTLDDMLKFDLALKSGKLITRETINQFLTPLTMRSGENSDYGLGVRIKAENNARFITHTGSTTGFWSYYQSALSDDGITIILFTNVVGADRRLAPIYNDIQDIIQVKNRKKNNE